jgi:hypothetical protein
MMIFSTCLLPSFLESSLSFDPKGKLEKHFSFLIPHLESLDLQLTHTQQRMKRFDPVHSLEMLSPLLLKSLDNLALGLFNDRGLDGKVFRGDVGLSLDRIIFRAQFLDLIQFNHIAQLNILESIQYNNIVLGNQVRTVLDLGHGVVSKLITKEVDR